MYGPGIGISVIAVPTGMGPFVAGNGGGGAVGATSDGVEEGRGVYVRPAADVAGALVTGESPEMSMGAWRAHAATAVPATAAAATAKNPRRFIAVPPLRTG
jgi:hypothetical protein